MHHIYRTKAFVINSFESKEADKDLIFLTQDFGLIRVKAQGVRKMTSKLRHSLQDFSLTEIAVVRGKNGYRLTNAKIEENFFYSVLTNRPETDLEKIKIISRIFSLITKLVHGEDEASLLFSILEKFVTLLKISEIKIENLETLTVVNILHTLGYFEKNIELTEENVLNITNSKRLKLIQEINKSIKATQL